MNYSNLFKIALRAIAANKLRSFLTALGIIIGVASVITMLAIGQGSKRSIQANIAEMGSNMIMISPGADRGPGGVRQDPSAMETLKLNDYNSIKDECHFIKGISPTVNSSGQWIYGNNNTPSSIYGVNQDYLEIRQLSVSEGEMFTDADIKASAKVCILGQTVVDNLFPDGSDPIGKVVRFNAIPFRVVGVLKKKGYNSMGMDQDDLVLAPYTTVMKRIKAQTFLGGITCSAITEDLTSKAIDEITDVLRRNHKLKEATDVQKADDDDFNIRSQEELASMMNSTTDMMTILLGCVAGIYLHSAVEHHHELRCLHLHGCVLRMVSGEEGCTARPYRSDTLRVKKERSYRIYHDNNVRLEDRLVDKPCSGLICQPSPSLYHLHIQPIIRMLEDMVDFFAIQLFV